MTLIHNDSACSCRGHSSPALKGEFKGDEGGRAIRIATSLKSDVEKLLLMQLCSLCRECVTRFRLSSPTKSGGERKEADVSQRGLKREKYARISCVHLSLDRKISFWTGGRQRKGRDAFWRMLTVQMLQFRI